MKKYLYLIKNAKIPTYLKYWLMYSSKKISLLIQSLPITLENTIKDLKIIINKIYGNTEQKTRSGINVLNPNNLVVASPFVSMDNNNVLTIEINSTGYFKTAFDNLNLPADIYTVYCEILSGTYTGGNLCFFDLTDTQINSEFNFKNSTTHFRTLNCPNGLNQLKIYQPYCSEETKIKLWIAKGEYTTMPPFEQYGASPSPDYPSPVNNITGDVEVKVQNKNLFDGTLFAGQTNTAAGITTKVNTDGSINIKGLGSDTYAGQLTIDLPSMPSYNGKSLTISITSDNTHIGCYIQNPRGYNKTITYDSSQPLKIRLQAITASSLDIDETFNIQLEQGTTATPYTPHQEQNYPISLGDIELCKIGMAQDYIYKENGNWYKYGAIGKKVFNGSESWSLSGTQVSGALKVYSTSAFDNNTEAYITAFKSNMFNKITFPEYSNASKMGACPQSVGINVSITNENYTLSTWKEFLQTNNLICYYNYSTPTTTQITDTTLINQLNALEQAYSYEDVTNISSNQNIYLDIDYIKRG